MKENLYKRLPPLERRPDGSLYRMTPAGANTTSISSSRRAGTIILFKTILNSNKAGSLGISINFNLWLDTDLNISPVDLYIIIGNTMDNAIEACDAFPSGHKPSISCTLRQKNHVLLYEISNPIPQVSVKKAGDIHGYGLENVKECVNRNSGFISVKTENDIFCVSITLNV